MESMLFLGQKISILSCSLLGIKTNVAWDLLEYADFYYFLLFVYFNNKRKITLFNIQK